ncbi:formylglycine-generating enzyme family protein [Sphingosinicella sp. BN140058]|uniref:formylglycine-generating enzyme family protein n=1 Tax=Sphingosinicella sp. BN140058 TaxID=1892855 RepID=UPI00352A4226
MQASRTRSLILTGFLVGAGWPAMAAGLAGGPPGSDDVPRSDVLPIAVGTVHESAHPKATVRIEQDCPDCPQLSRIEIPESVGTRARVLTVGRFEVTWKEYLKSVDDASCPIPSLLDGTKVDPRDPRLRDRVAVTGMGYKGAECYVQWLSRRTGKVYRLPTVEEWEFAARGGAASRYPWGDALGFNNALVGTAFDMLRYPMIDVYDQRMPSNIRVTGLLSPNRFGLHDVVGNAFELTSTAVVLPVEECWPGETPPCHRLIIKSGPLEDDAPLSQTFYMKATMANANTGFRVVRDEAK